MPRSTVVVAASADGPATPTTTSAAMTDAPRPAANQPRRLLAGFRRWPGSEEEKWWRNVNLDTRWSPSRRKRALPATRYVSSLLKMSLVYSTADVSSSKAFFATGGSPEACSATTIAGTRGCGDRGAGRGARAPRRRCTTAGRGRHPYRSGPIMPGTLPTSATLARATLARATLRGASPFARATLPGTTLPGARANLPGARATLPGPTLLPTATVFTERLGVYEHGDQVAAVVAVWIGLSEVRCSSTQGRLRVTSWERGRPSRAAHGARPPSRHLVGAWAAGTRRSPGSLERIAAPPSSSPWIRGRTAGSSFPSARAAVRRSSQFGRASLPAEIGLRLCPGDVRCLLASTPA